MNKVILSVIAAVCVGAVLMLPAPAVAKNCGKVGGATIVTHGVSCKKAARIYRRFKNGDKLPKGWVCGLSAGGCSKGSKSFTFRFNG